MKLGISSHALRLSGGIERYAMDLVDGFTALGIQPVFFAKRFDDTLPACRLVQKEQINVRWLPARYRDAWFAARLPKRQRAAGVDLLIGCNRIASADIAICGGTHIGFMRATHKQETSKDRMQIKLERAHYQHARLIVAHSRAMQTELIDDYGVAPGKIRVIYPPAAAERFSPINDERRVALRQQLGWPGDRIIFAFPSSSHERKGLPALAHFFESTDLPVTLAVVGRPLPRTWRNVQYLGYHADIEQIYQAADFTVLASTYEPFGLVGIESVLCGTPVLLADGIGSTEVLDDAAQINFGAQDAEGLARAVASAVQRVRQGTARLRQPASHISYATDTRTHAQALLDAWREAA